MERAKVIYEGLADKTNKSGNMEAIVKKINALLVNNSPGALVAGLEHFVAILRNSRSASNVDVELFFLDAKKLTTKLRRMEPTQLKYENVQIHRDQIASIIDKFEDNPRPAKDEVNLGPYKPLVEWGLEFATAAEMMLKVEKINADIVKLQAKKKGA